MTALFYQLYQQLNRFSQVTGKLLRYLSIAMMLCLSTVALLRYGFNIGFIALQELVTYLHATVFMLGIAYTLSQDEHVRVDIFYQRFSLRGKAWINAIGGIVFLIPICGYFLLSSWGFVSQSWQIHEGSVDPGGLPAVFLLKSLIPAMAITLLLQGLAEILKNLLFLMRVPGIESLLAEQGGHEHV